MTDRELMQMALDSLIDAVDSQSWEMQLNIDQHGEWYRRSVYLKEAVIKSQETIEALRARLAQPNDFNPEWDAMAVMVEHQQRMAKRIEELEGQLAQPEPESIGQHEFIDTTAKWGRDFVEVLNPLEENSILRFYHEPPQQPEPKPVAWMWDVYNGAGFTSRGIDFSPTDIPFAKHTPLYTAPPQPEWVGLTDEDREWCDEHSHGNTSWAKQKAYGRAIEAKLKEKNYGNN